MMRRAIVHIGTPRTGSTSFQTVLTNLRARLSEAGILYPALAGADEGPSANVNHQRLGEALDGRRNRAYRRAVLERLDESLRCTQADTVILSYEDFSVQKPRFNVPGLLREVFARRGFAMEVVLVVKPAFALLNSAYALRTQLVREPLTFQQFARQHWRSRRLDYEGLIGPWRRATDGRVTVVPLRDARSSAPFLTRIIASLGLSTRLDPLLDSGLCNFVTNRSSGPVAVEASRRLSALRVHRQVRGHSRQIGHVLDNAAWARDLDPVLFRGRAPEICERLQTRHAAANERFARLAWGTTWSSVIPAEDWTPNELAGTAIPPETERNIASLVALVNAHFAFSPPPFWRRTAEDCLEAAAARLSRATGLRDWRLR